MNLLTLYFPPVFAAQHEVRILSRYVAVIE